VSDAGGGVVEQLGEDVRNLELEDIAPRKMRDNMKAGA
jgi:hypothetical protein